MFQQIQRIAHCRRSFKRLAFGDLRFDCVSVRNGCNNGVFQVANAVFSKFEPFFRSYFYDFAVLRAKIQVKYDSGDFYCRNFRGFYLISS